MSTPSPSARTYKRLGYLALAHAAIVLVLLESGIFWNETTENRTWLKLFWIGLVTLWFLWPIVLVLHRGRSALRLGAFALLSAVLLWPSLRFYDIFAPEAFGLPRDISTNPIRAWKYYSAYRDGRAEAQKDVAAGILVIEEYGLPGPGLAHYVRIMREQNQIEVRRVAGCVVDEEILGHAAGYNEISVREIDRRVGRFRVDAAREEGARLGEEEYAREEQFSKDLAKRLSSLPPDAKIMTESIRPYVNEQLSNDAAAERELAELVHVVERCLIDTVPEDAPPFKMYVRAKSMPDASPTFEVSAQGFSPPEALWRAIYENFETMSAPRWTKEGRLSVSFDFAIRSPR